MRCGSWLCLLFVLIIATAGNRSPADAQALTLSTPNTTFQFGSSTSVRSGSASGFGLGLGLRSNNFGELGIFQDRLFNLYNRLQNYQNELSLFSASSDPDWLHWWEIHRHEYLPPFPHERYKQEGELPPNEALALGRTMAAGPILGGLNDANAQVRWASAISAGRLDLAIAIPQLIELTQDPDVRVNMAAWAALGLIDTAQSRQTLLFPQDIEALTNFQQAGRMYGIGFLEENNPEIEQLLIDAAAQPNPDEVRRAAMASLRKLNPQRAAELADHLIHSASDYGLADESLIALADGDFKVYEPIAKIMTQRLGRMDGLPLYQPFLDLKMNSPDLTTQLDRWEAFGYVNATRTRVILNWIRSRPLLRKWVTTQRQDRAATIALTLMRNDLTDAMLKEQYLDFDGRHWFYRPMPLLALGAIGDERDADLLSKALNGDLYLMPGVDVAPFLVNQNEFRLALSRRDRARTYAALAVGIYLRESGPDTRIPQPTNPDRVHPRWVGNYARQLAGAINNAYEDTAFRCAAAIGMGISGQPGMRDRLKETLVKLKPDAANPTVVAHGLLGLSMLRQSANDTRDDAFILQSAKQLMDTMTAYTQFTQDNLLTWRALLLAVSRIDQPEAVAALMAASHGRHPYLDEVVIECLGQSMVFDILPALITRAQAQENAGKAFDLWQIGALLDPRTPNEASRLWTLVDDLNHTLPMVNVPDEPGFTIENPLGPRPLGVLQRMVIPGYFDLMHGGAMHRVYTYR